MNKVLLTFIIGYGITCRAHASISSVEYSRLMSVSALSLGYAPSDIQPNEELRISTSSLIALFVSLDRDYRANDLPTFYPDRAAQNYLLMASCNRTTDTLEGGVRKPIFTAECLASAIARAR